MKFEIDINDLIPGSVIDQSRCEDVIGYPRSKDKYEWQFALMQLGAYVQQLLWKDGKHWTVKTCQGEIVVLTHEEASKYNSARFDGAIRKMRRSFERMVAVDVGKLGRDMRQQHDHTISKQSRVLQSVSRANRDLEPVAVKRDVPRRARRG